MVGAKWLFSLYIVNSLQNRFCNKLHCIILKFAWNGLQLIIVESKFVSIFVCCIIWSITRNSFCHRFSNIKMCACKVLGAIHKKCFTFQLNAYLVLKKKSKHFTRKSNCDTIFTQTIFVQDVMHPISLSWVWW